MSVGSKDIGKILNIKNHKSQINNKMKIERLGSMKLPKVILDKLPSKTEQNITSKDNRILCTSNYLDDERKSEDNYKHERINKFNRVSKKITCINTKHRTDLQKRKPRPKSKKRKEYIQTPKVVLERLVMNHMQQNAILIIKESEIIGTCSKDKLCRKKKAYPATTGLCKSYLENNSQKVQNIIHDLGSTFINNINTQSEHQHLTEPSITIQNNDNVIKPLEQNPCKMLVIQNKMKNECIKKKIEKKLIKKSELHEENSKNLKKYKLKKNSIEFEKEIDFNNENQRILRENEILNESESNNKKDKSHKSKDYKGSKQKNIPNKKCRINENMHQTNINTLNSSKIKGIKNTLLLETKKKKKNLINNECVVKISIMDSYKSIIKNKSIVTEEGNKERMSLRKKKQDNMLIENVNTLNLNKKANDNKLTETGVLNETNKRQKRKFIKKVENRNNFINSDIFLNEEKKNENKKTDNKLTKLSIIGKRSFGNEDIQKDYIVRENVHTEIMNEKSNNITNISIMKIEKGNTKNYQTLNTNKKSSRNKKIQSKMVEQNNSTFSTRKIKITESENILNEKMLNKEREKDFNYSTAIQNNEQTTEIRVSNISSQLESSQQTPLKNVVNSTNETIGVKTRGKKISIHVNPKYVQYSQQKATEANKKLEIHSEQNNQNDKIEVYSKNKTLKRHDKQVENETNSENRIENMTIHKNDSINKIAIIKKIQRKTSISTEKFELYDNDNLNINITDSRVSKRKLLTEVKDQVLNPTVSKRQKISNKILDNFKIKDYEWKFLFEKGISKYITVDIERYEFKNMQREPNDIVRIPKEPDTIYEALKMDRKKVVIKKVKPIRRNKLSKQQNYRKDISKQKESKKLQVEKEIATTITSVDDIEGELNMEGAPNNEIIYEPQAKKSVIVLSNENEISEMLVENIANNEKFEGISETLEECTGEKTLINSVMSELLQIENSVVTELTSQDITKQKETNYVSENKMKNVEKGIIIETIVEKQNKKILESCLPSDSDKYILTQKPSETLKSLLEREIVDKSSGEEIMHIEDEPFLEQNANITEHISEENKITEKVQKSMETEIIVDIINEEDVITIEGESLPIEDANKNLQTNVENEISKVQETLTKNNITANETFKVKNIDSFADSQVAPAVEMIIEKENTNNIVETRLIEHINNDIIVEKESSRNDDAIIEFEKETAEDIVVKSNKHIIYETLVQEKSVENGRIASSEHDDENMNETTETSIGLTNSISTDNEETSTEEMINELESNEEESIIDLQISKEEIQIGNDVPSIKRKTDHKLNPNKGTKKQKKSKDRETVSIEEDVNKYSIYFIDKSCVQGNKLIIKKKVVHKSKKKSSSISGTRSSNIQENQKCKKYYDKDTSIIQDSNLCTDDQNSQCTITQNNSIISLADKERNSSSISNKESVLKKLSQKIIDNQKNRSVSNNESYVNEIESEREKYADNNHIVHENDEKRNDMSSQCSFWKCVNSIEKYVKENNSNSVINNDVENLKKRKENHTRQNKHVLKKVVNGSNTISKQIIQDWISDDECANESVIECSSDEDDYEFVKMGSRKIIIYPNSNVNSSSNKNGDLSIGLQEAFEKISADISAANSSFDANGYNEENNQYLSKVPELLHISDGSDEEDSSSEVIETVDPILPIDEESQNSHYSNNENYNPYETVLQQTTFDLNFKREPHLNLSPQIQKRIRLLEEEEDDNIEDTKNYNAKDDEMHHMQNNFSGEEQNESSSTLRQLLIAPIIPKPTLVVREKISLANHADDSSHYTRDNTRVTSHEQESSVPITDANAPARCSKCNCMYINRERMLDHLSNCGEMLDLYCRICKSKFRYRRSLMRHVHAQHQEHIPPGELTNMIDDIVERAKKGQEPVFYDGVSMDQTIDIPPHIILFCAHCATNYKSLPVIYYKKTCDNCNSHLFVNCRRCKKSYFLSPKVDAHIQGKCVERGQRYCSHCDFSTPSLSKLQRHIVRKHQNSLVAFQMCIKGCGRKFRFKDSKLKHEKACGQEKHLQCRFCSFKSKYKSGMRMHMQQHIVGSKVAVYGTAVEVIGELDIDYRGMSRNSLSTEEIHNAIQVYCKNCNQRSDFKKQRMVCEVCKNKLLHQCKICQYANESFYQTKMHMFRKHGEKNLSCQFCGKKYAFEIDMKNHETVCVKPLMSCNLCAYQTKNKKLMHQHELRMHPTHIDEKLTCNRCGKMFTSKQALKKHRDVYCGVEPKFSCAHCSFITKTKFSLLRHIQNMHQEIYECFQFLCKKCNKVFSNLFSHENHIKSCRVRKSSSSYTKRIAPTKNHSLIDHGKYTLSYEDDKLDFSCDKCGLYFGSVSDYNNHVPTCIKRFIN